MSEGVAGVRCERDGAVGVVTLDRFEDRNALTDGVLGALAAHFAALDVDDSIRCIVLAGRDEIFASGAGIRDLLNRTPVEHYGGARSRAWDILRATRTPVVAAVSGVCLGGGCELAMMADIVIASVDARFGLPETQLGLIPGAGGTQMLPRAVGKAIAMDVILTGRRLSADEAERAGLVSRVVPADAWLDTACEVAARIAERPAVAQRVAKEAVLSSFEMPLTAGIAAERRSFLLAFATEDAREGLTAFLEKRKPGWVHR
jgi:enoyl-CoA hydratase